jgi:hypothetical protein
MDEIIKIMKIKELGRVAEEIQNFHIVQVSKLFSRECKNLNTNSSNLQCQQDECSMSIGNKAVDRCPPIKYVNRHTTHKKITRHLCI